jgi:hypothetical protein
MLSNYNDFLSSIGMPQNNPRPLFYDNRNVIHLVKNLEFHHRSKHIDPQYHFIWAKQEFTEIDIHYIPIINEIVDMLTKLLSFEKTCHLHK